MKVGYVRIAGTNTDISRQIDALKQAGCKHIFTDRVGRLQKEYPGLTAALNYMQETDTLVVWRLGHLGHSLTDLVGIINRLETLGFGFQSLQDSIDTTTSKGQFIYQIFAALGEFERNLIRERTMYGLVTARAMGRKGGRPKGLSKKAQHTAATAERLYQEGNLTVKEICEYLSISRTTFYRYLRHREVAIGAPRESTCNSTEVTDKQRAENSFD